MDLMEIHRVHKELDLYEFGAAMSNAFHSPKDLRKLDPTREKFVLPTSGPLAIPKKKKALNA